MDAVENEPIAYPNSFRGIQSCGTVEVQAKAGPLGLNAGIHIQPQTHVDGPAHFPGNAFRFVDFVEAVEIDDCPFPESRPERFGRFEGTVVNYRTAGDSEPSRLLVFEVGHHFGQFSFLVEDGANSIQVVGLVRP